MPNVLQQVAPGTQLQSGDPAYEEQMFQSRQKLLAPQYAKAVQQARQSSQNRGLYNSGLGQEQEQQLGQEFRQATNENAGAAALTGADQAEYNRRAEIARQFALRQQQMQNEFAGSQQDKALQAQERAQWANALGGAAGLVGKGAVAALFPPAAAVV